MITTSIECTDLDTEMAWFLDDLGFRVHLVSPADDPARVVLHGDGGAVELRRSSVDRPATIRIDGPVGRVATSPGGTTVTIDVSAPDDVLGAPMAVPANAPTLTVVDGSSGDFGSGRAGMEYRDLLPGRWGGRFIASHIRIADGGDVADWVHFHRIRFQMIYVAAGWVDVVYEDQGPPFRMHVGDCVLQPPEIRHRVLRSSPGFEVIEIGCPAEHDTIADHDLELPNPGVEVMRRFSGQQFNRHVADGALTRPWIDPLFEVRGTDLGIATDGLAGVSVVTARSAPGEVHPQLTHDGEFVLLVGLDGDAHLEVDGRQVLLSPRSSVALPPGSTWAWSDRSFDHQALVVEMPNGTIRTA